MCTKKGRRQLLTYLNLGQKLPLSKRVCTLAMAQSGQESNIRQEKNHTDIL